MLSYCQIKSLTYNTYVRLIVELLLSFGPLMLKISQLEIVQCKAARFVFNNFSTYFSVLHACFPS